MTTRERFTQKLDSDAATDNGSYALSYDITFIDNLFSEIFDDFESRICENCIDKGKNSCPVYDHEYGTTPSDIGFGCTEFTRKES